MSHFPTGLSSSWWYVVWTWLRACFLAIARRSEVFLDLWPSGAIPFPGFRIWQSQLKLAEDRQKKRPHPPYWFNFFRGEGKTPTRTWDNSGSQGQVWVWLSFWEAVSFCEILSQPFDVVHSIAEDLEIILMKMVLLLEEIPNNHLGFFKIPVNLDIYHIHWWFYRISEPSTVSFGINHCLRSSKPTPESPGSST